MIEEAPLDTTVFNGRVKMIDSVRGYGFIVYRDHDGTSKDIFFHVSNVSGGEPVRRAKVSFQLKFDDKGGRTRTIAGNVVVLKDSIKQIPDCRGHIDWFDKGYGYIIADSDKSAGGVFVHVEEVLRNAGGHRCFLKPGVELLFTLNERDEQDPYKKFFATDARLAEDNSTPDRPEFSQVARWDRNKKHGMLNRSCGCKLPFRADDVATEGIESICIGDWVQHTTATDGTSWFATNVTLFEPGYEPEPVYEPGSAEQFFVQVPELPVGPSSAVAEPQPIYTADERKCSLREIIRRRKIAA